MSAIVVALSLITQSPDQAGIDFFELIGQCFYREVKKKTSRSSAGLAC